MPIAITALGLRTAAADSDRGLGFSLLVTCGPEIKNPGARRKRAPGPHCGLYAVVYSRDDESGASGVQVRMSLNAGQVVHIDNADQKSLGLQCWDNAETLRIVEPSTRIADDATK